MTLDELSAIDAASLWAALKPEQQAAIGVAAVRREFSQLVAEDDGSDATAVDRNKAIELASWDQADLSAAVEAAFSHIAWWSE